MRVNSIRRYFGSSPDFVRELVSLRKAQMDWQQHIHSDPDILLGKPVVKGTRLSVDFILGLLAKGWTEAQIYDNYPTLTPLSLQAVFAFAAESMREEIFYALPTAGE